MTDIAPAPRRGHGCLWGCLAVLGFFLLPVMLTAGYGGWFLYQGYRSDPVLQGVGELVRRDGMAEMVLGQDIQVVGVQGSALNYYMWGGDYIWGNRSGSYVVLLRGSKGQGELHVTAHTNSGKLAVDSMILDGPDGGHYDLIHHTAAPGAGPTTSI